MTTTNNTPANPPTETPGQRLKAAKMPGHWLLARAGKRVLRPGGRELTNAILDRLAITSADDVVELAPGLGATASLIRELVPKTYTGVEREEAAAQHVMSIMDGPNHRCVVSSAQQTGLDAHSADVIVGEAFLTMQSDENRATIVNEAFRVLRPGGRYGIHELCLQPDELPVATQEAIQGELARAIRVNARPITVADWKAVLERAGFVVEFEHSTAMALLEPRRMIADEGILRTLKIIFNVLRSKETRQRVRTMRATFRRHAHHLGAIGLVATKPTS